MHQQAAGALRESKVFCRGLHKGSFCRLRRRWNIWQSQGMAEARVHEVPPPYPPVKQLGKLAETCRGCPVAVGEERDGLRASLSPGSGRASGKGLETATGSSAAHGEARATEEGAAFRLPSLSPLPTASSFAPCSDWTGGIRTRFRCLEKSRYWAVSILAHEYSRATSVANSF